VYVERSELRVPLREIAVGRGEPPLRVYDTSGPQGIDAHDGLPPTIRRGARRNRGATMRCCAVRRQSC
jgi:phosphomethylpyrimidine synthase